MTKTTVTITEQSEFIADTEHAEVIEVDKSKEAYVNELLKTLLFNETYEDVVDTKYGDIVNTDDGDINAYMSNGVLYIENNEDEDDAIRVKYEFS